MTERKPSNPYKSSCLTFLLAIKLLFGYTMFNALTKGVKTVYPKDSNVSNETGRVQSGTFSKISSIFLLFLLMKKTARTAEMF